MNYRKQIPTVIIVLTFSLVLTCCGFYPKKVGPAGPDGRQLTWAEMSFEQRQDHMRAEVLPVAADIFSTWRPQRFATIDCSLCHAEAEINGNYDMPTANLPKLSGELLLGPEFAREPETTRLKLNRLVPEISAALGVKPFSIITRKGFGCYSCHLGPDGPVFGN
jgi:hypothetical protein